MTRFAFAACLILVASAMLPTAFAGCTSCTQGYVFGNDTPYKTLKIKTVEGCRSKCNYDSECYGYVSGARRVNGKFNYWCELFDGNFSGEMTEHHAAFSIECAGFCS